MRLPTLEEQKELVRQMEEGYRLLDEMRREALRNKPYDWKEVDALLSLPDRTNLPPRTSEGLVEMQRIFMKARGAPNTDD